MTGHQQTLAGETIGILAGWGRFPIAVAEAVKRRGGRVAILSIRDHADSQLESIADAHGMTVSMTTTINQNFGARIAVGGFYLNNVMTNFATEAATDGVPPANAIAPGKRAKTTIAPLLVCDATGMPVAALGAGGGYRIIGYVANALLRLAGGMRDPQAIVAAPHVLNWNGLTEIEPRLGHLERPLGERGHWLVNKRLDGGTQCIIRSGGRWQAAGDPRRDGVGMGVG